jgi:fatty acid desaturase
MLTTTPASQRALHRLPRRPLFRERSGRISHSLALLYATLGWPLSFFFMAARSPWLAVPGVLLCAHSMVIAAYLIHEAAHQNIFTTARANRRLGEVMGFIAGACYASFERIRHMHMRHHVDRADLTCFDFKGLMQRHPALRRTLQACEWAYVPATEILMRLQVICRPFVVPTQRRHLPRVLSMLLLRAALLALLGLASWRALLLYGLALLLQLHVLNFFDAFHHSFEQYVVAADEPVSIGERDRAYEQRHTYSNLICSRHPWLNLLTLNFSYHNAHHQRASVPWHRLPALHRELYGDQSLAVLPLSELLRTWHCNRVRRVCSDDYGIPTAEAGRGRADAFVGAHGVSFLSVV